MGAMFEKTLLGQFLHRINLFEHFDYEHQKYYEVDIKKDVQKSSGKRREVDSVVQDIIWSNVAMLAIVHSMAVYTLTFIPQVTLSLFLWFGLILFAGGLGVTGGAHRLWSHRAYKAKWPFQIFLLICYTISGQNSVYDWVRDHRVHHKFSETDADPHNAKRGFFFSHVGWLMMKKHPEVIEKGRQLDMSDIANNPLLAFHTRYFVPLKLVFCFVLPTVVPPLAWGEAWPVTIMMLCFLRYVLNLNITWSVNSAAHIWGNKPYDKRINPSENLAVAVAALGEGWHNYHHVFPWDYKAAELGGYSTNLTTLVIDTAARWGLAYDLKQPSAQLIETMALKHGDGTRSSPPTYPKQL